MTKKLKEIYNYGEIVNKIHSEFSFKKDVISSEDFILLDDPRKKNTNPLDKNFEIIMLDVNRTCFRENQENKRNSISNILKAIMIVNPALSYCQGMSYISAFIIEFIKDEEESFYLMLGLFINTNYCEIFNNDLYKLKHYFLILDKVISLKEPEVQTYLINTGINSSYYASSWIITLFTNCLQNIIDYEEPKFILSIWDRFLIFGWRAVINACFALIKCYSNEILNLKFEDLLGFLINDITRTGFIQNKYSSIFLEYLNRSKISSEFFSSLDTICILEEH